MMAVLDNVFPTFNLMGSMLEATRLFRNNPNYMTACAASGLAYMMLVAAEEDELAARLKGEDLSRWPGPKSTRVPTCSASGPRRRQQAMTLTRSNFTSKVRSG